MTQDNYTTKKKTFKYLNYEKRKIIEELLSDNVPKSKIANLLRMQVKQFMNKTERTAESFIKSLKQ